MPPFLVLPGFSFFPQSQLSSSSFRSILVSMCYWFGCRILIDCRGIVFTPLWDQASAAGLRELCHLSPVKSPEFCGASVGWMQSQHQQRCLLRFCGIFGQSWSTCSSSSNPMASCKANPNQSCGLFNQGLTIPNVTLSERFAPSSPPTCMALRKPWKRFQSPDSSDFCDSSLFWIVTKDIYYRRPRDLNFFFIDTPMLFAILTKSCLAIVLSSNRSWFRIINDESNPQLLLPLRHRMAKSAKCVQFSWKLSP